MIRTFILEMERRAKANIDPKFSNVNLLSRYADKFSNILFKLASFAGPQPSRALTIPL